MATGTAESDDSLRKHVLGVRIARDGASGGPLKPPARPPPHDPLAAPPLPPHRAPAPPLPPADEPAARCAEDSLASLDDSSEISGPTIESGGLSHPPVLALPATCPNPRGTSLAALELVCGGIARRPGESKSSALLSEFAKSVVVMSTWEGGGEH